MSSRLAFTIFAFILRELGASFIVVVDMELFLFIVELAKGSMFGLKVHSLSSSRSAFALSF